MVGNPAKILRKTKDQELELFNELFTEMHKVTRIIEESMNTYKSSLKYTKLIVQEK